MTMVVFRALAVQLGDFNSQEVANIPWAFDSQTIASRKRSTNCFPKRFVLQSVFPKPIFSKIGDATTDRGKNCFSKVFPNIGYSKTDFCPTSVFPKPIFPKKSANIDQTLANNLPKSADIGQQSTRNLPKSTKIGNQTIKISQNSAKVNWPGWASGVID